MFTAQYFAIDKEKLIIDQKELKRRLSVSGDFDVSVFETAVEKVIAESTPKACFVKVPVMADEKGVEFPFGGVESRDIAKNLCGCSEAFIFAVTLGHGTERLLSKISRLSAADFFVYDAAVDAMPTAKTMSYSSHKEEVSINANPGTLVTIYHANGAKAISHIQTIANAPISVAHLPAGAYVIGVGGKTLKFVKQ